MAHISISEAGPMLPELVLRTEQGEEIVITRRGTPVARLAPIEASGSRAELFGLMRGHFDAVSDWESAETWAG
jgi:prevent-host-death family protein